MSKIKAFRGLRPLPELIEKFSVLPYDVVNSDEARELAKGNKYSFFHVTKPEIDLPAETDLYSDIVYEKAKKNFMKFISDKILIPDSKPSFYVYRQEMLGKTQTGLMVCASVDEYEKDLIKKHELTRKDKEDDRARHVYETNCNAGPVFLTYKSLDEIDKAIEKICSGKPVYDFKIADSGIEVRHILYIVDNDALINSLIASFEKVSCLYVADGHHRAASGFRVRAQRRNQNSKHTGEEEYNYFLAVLFPHNQLKIMDYNRAVKDLNNNSPEEILRKISEKFKVEKLDIKNYKPSSTKNIGMYIDGVWYNLSPLQGIYNASSPVDSLDVSILQKNILAPILNIQDPRTDNRISFIGGIRGAAELERLVDSGKYKIAFSMYPTLIEELMGIADAGMIMPPKSTWFEPKLRSSLVVHLLDDVDNLLK